LKKQYANQMATESRKAVFSVRKIGFSQQRDDVNAGANQFFGLTIILNA